MLKTTYTYILVGYNPKINDNNEQLNLLVNEFKNSIKSNLDLKDPPINHAIPILKNFLIHRKNFS